MAVRIEEFVAHLGWEVDPGKLEEFKKQLKGVKESFKTVVKWVGLAKGALTALTIVANKQTAEMANLAASVGISTESLIAIDGVAQSLGKDTESIVDLVEEMNNKFGEMKGLGELTSLKEGTKLLGLEFENLRDLEPEQQFLTILDAAKDLEDQQKAVSGVDMIFGGEANKILGSIRQIDGSLADLIERRKQLNFLSEQGVESARIFNALWIDAKTVVTSIGAQFAALLGEALSPLLNEFLSWVAANRELIKLRIAEWAEKVARFMTSVFRVLRVIVSIIDRIVTAFGGLENVLALLAGLGTGIFLVKLVKTFQALLPLISTATARTAAFKAVMTTGKAAGFIGLLVLAGLAINSLVRFLQGKDSLVGDIGDSIAESAHRGVQALADFFGFSKEEFDVWLVGVVDGIADAFTAVWDTVVSIFEGLRNLTWADISDAFAQTFERMKAVITGFFEELMVIDWSTIGDVWKEIFFDVVETIKGWINSLISTITSVPDKVNSIISSIKSLPFFGGEETPRRRATPTTTSRTAAAIPSTIATQAAAQTRSIQNITNQQRSARQVSQRNTFNISQRPGEDAQGFARRVAAVLETEAATAVRDNATGIVK